MIDDVYLVHLTDSAMEEIREIGNYIARVLGSPETAKKTIVSLQEGLNVLSEVPTKRPVISEQPWGNFGIRKIRIGNYYAYYFVHNEIHQVDVLGICYIRRDQESYLQALQYE